MVDFQKNNNNMKFLRVNLEIDKLTTQFTMTDSIHAHAFIMKKISAADHIFGKELHDMQRNKPLNVAIINNRLVINIYGENALKIMQMIISQLHTDPVIKLGSRNFDILNITPGIQGGKQYWNWNDITSPSQKTILHFSFITPTAIMRQDSHKNRYTVLSPEPDLIFLNLHRKWQSMNGITLPTGLNAFLNDGGCVIKKFNLKSLVFPDKLRKQVGFVGNVTYLCRYPHESHIQSLNWLSRFAQFVGIGYQTMRGMGFVSTKLLK